MINDKKFPVVFPEENTYYNSKRFTWDHFWILWFLEFTPPTWPKLFRDLSAFFPAREYSVLRPRFPGRTPWPFSCTVPKLAKFYSACYMLHTTEYWLPVQGFFLKKKKKNHRIFLQSAGHTISLIWLCVSANLPAWRGFLSFGVCSKGQRGLRMPRCSELLSDAEVYVSGSYGVSSLFSHVTT